VDKNLGETRDAEAIPTKFDSIVKHLMDPTANQEEVVIRFDDFSLSRADLKCMAPTEWVSSDVLNAYMGLLELRASKMLLPTSSPKCKFFGSHLYELLTLPKYQFNSVLPYVRGVDIFSYDRVFFPVHQSEREHWVLVVADFKAQQLQLLDSLCI
jgi:Ulp1 family protease